MIWIIIIFLLVGLFKLVYDQTLTEEELMDELFGTSNKEKGD